MRRLFLLFALSVIVHAASAETISGKVVAIADGDTLTVQQDKKRHRIRLAEIDAPERKQSFGNQSRNSLAEICFQKPAVVEIIGKPSNGRQVGKVSCAGVDASTEQVRRGMAWVFAGASLPNSPLPEMEAHARLRGLGLWAGKKPEPPWEWRKRQAAKK